jgi:hypothetical protein
MEKQMRPHIHLFSIEELTHIGQQFKIPPAFLSLRILEAKCVPYPRQWTSLTIDFIPFGDEWFSYLTRTYSNEELMQPRSISHQEETITVYSYFTEWMLCRCIISNWNLVFQYANEYYLDFAIHRKKRTDKSISSRFETLVTCPSTYLDQFTTQVKIQMLYSVKDLIFHLVSDSTKRHELARKELYSYLDKNLIAIVCAHITRYDFEYPVIIGSD